MMKRIVLLLAAGLSLYSCGKIHDEYIYGEEETINWAEAADKSTESLISGFWNPEGYFNYGSNASDVGFQYWPNAHAMDVVIDAYLRTKDDKYKAYFSKWYEGIKVKNGNTYYNEFYDDMEWIGITLLRIYQITNEDNYLATARELWIDIENGWNDEYGDGGVAWTKSMPHSKNACSNGPASLMAIRLYEATNEESYKEWALKIYDWQKNTLYERSTGAVYDNLNGLTQSLDRTALTYNQGLFMATAVELYKLTEDGMYLNDAQKIANYTITKCIDASNNILRNEGAGDGALFKGIFMRYFVSLLQLDELNEAYKSKFITFFNNNARTLWTSGTYPTVLLYGSAWNEPPIGNAQLTAQASACMLLEAKAYFEANGK